MAELTNGDGQPSVGRLGGQHTSPKGQSPGLQGDLDGSLGVGAGLGHPVDTLREVSTTPELSSADEINGHLGPLALGQPSMAARVSSALVLERL